MEKKETFNYTYSAEQQEEIRSIRAKYTEPEQKEDKMMRLRRLDAGVTQKATVVSLIFGILGALILGSGMSLFMSDLSTVLGMSAPAAMITGLALGIVGIALVCLAYPVYNRILKKERARIAPEILRLTEELIK